MPDDRDLNDEGFCWEDGLDRKGESVYYCVTRVALLCLIVTLAILAYGCVEDVT